MVSRIFTPLRDYNLNQFLESIGEANTHMYLFIGKNTSWTNDATPDTPTGKLEEFYQSWKDMIALKKLSAANMVPIVKRYDWESGTIYTQWDSGDENIFLKNFYVMNSNYDVYKCLSNNSGIASTVQPTGTGTTNITTGDGYVWKYLYTISTGDALTFLSTTWMPVSTNSTVAAVAVDGAIERINVLTGGSGYTTPPTVSISSSTGGSGATATATISGGAVTGITVNTKGVNYRDVTINLTGGGGTGATASAEVGPFGGHGSNPEKELGCTHLMVTSEIIGTEFPIGISYRKVGVMLNPQVAAGTLATDTIYDDPLTDLKVGSGEIFYIEHRIPINRTSDSTENFKFAIRF